jgi:iron complex transport system substrate-binding protein
VCGVRIVSLLPSVTEILFAVGAGDSVVGVTFECDHPPEARTRRIVSTSALPEGLSSAEIDAVVAARIGAGEDLYHLDEGALADLAADLVVTQDLCAVCAVDAGDVAAAMAHLGCDGRVLTVAPTDLEGVLASIVAVGAAAGARPAAEELVASLLARLAAVRARVAGASAPRALVLEWTDPPYAPGHWVPDMVVAAGGVSALGAPGERSVRVSWDDVAAARPDVVVCAPCGLGLEAAVAVSRAALGAGLLPPGVPVWAVDANASYARPGPRLVDGVATLAGILHPDRAGPPDPRTAQILRSTPVTTPASVTSPSGTIGA